MAFKFVGLADDDKPIFLTDRAGKRVRQVLWGDNLTLDVANPSADPALAHIVWGASGPSPKQMRIETRHVVDDRPLEIIFVDVGQGDGCIVLTPERQAGERILVIDAGKNDHMRQFLDQRFKIGANVARLTFHAAIVTHPDEDHYGGFTPIFGNTQARFEHFYHSGLVERPVAGEWPKLGGKTQTASEKRAYLRGLVATDAEMRALFGATTGFSYPEMIREALDRQAVGSFAMLSNRHGALEDAKSWLPGFAPSDALGYTIEVLGPWVENDGDGDKLRTFRSDYGVTKNGHSVILRLVFGDFSVLFGGDLNEPAERFLLHKYTGITKWPATIIERDIFVAEARKRLKSDVMKVCHHGASDVTDEFLMAVNPGAFVVSSGDQEGHVHPRPDLLGRLGRAGRGVSPVLLLTELQRSTREQEDAELGVLLRDLIAKQVEDPTTKRAEAIDAAITRLSRSNVEVDGAIYLKTDGKRLITAFRNEVNSDKKKWFYFRYSIENGMLVPRSVSA